MKYINDKQECGIKYDWKKVRNKFKELEIPNEFYNPCTAPLDKASWFTLISQRSTGKTTNVLLLGMVLNQMYGTQIHYVRNFETEIMPKHSKNMFSVIVENDYISKLTNNEYNNVLYKSRKWYFSKVNERGEIEKIADEYFLYMCSVDKAGNLKSSHNAPKGDIILFDEFISISYRYICNFVEFCDLCKTILRDRLSGKIFLLANTIDKEHQYFHELEIYQRISQMQIGENALHTTDKGTKIYIEIVGAPNVLKKRKVEFNKLFLGFRNTRLSGITGETTWSIKNYPHIPNCEFKSLYRKIYIYNNNKLVNIEFVYNELGICLYCHWSTYLHEDSKILITTTPLQPNEYHAIPDNKIGKLIICLFKKHKVYFSSNDVGSFVQNFFNQCGININIT